jgi:hypothetical protein
MNSQPNEILAAFAQRIVRTILDILGKDNVDSIFVSGSVPRGRIASSVQSGVLEIYSDLDIYVIIKDSIGLELSRNRVRRAVSEISRTGDGFRILPAPDVGVYSLDDFFSQRVRPGTVEISSCHTLLFGNETTPRKADVFRISEIDPTEAMYLLENRLTEIRAMKARVESGAGADVERYLRYTRLKSCADVATAILITLGKHSTVWSERVAAFREVLADPQQSGFSISEAESCFEGCVTALEGLYSGTGDPATDPPEACDHAESILLEAWRVIAEHLGAANTDSWAELVGWRCRKGRWKTNLREVLALAKRMSVSRLRLINRADRLSKFSPIESLRLSGAVEVLLLHDGDDLAGATIDRKRLQKGYLGGVEELTRSFGYDDGSLFDRCRQMFKETT